MEHPQSNWIPVDRKLQQGEVHGQKRQDQSRPILEFSNNNSEGLNYALRAIYIHLYQKHYLDRLTHALYTCKGNSLSKAQHEMTKEERDDIAFTRMIRVAFPHQTELQQIIRQVRSSPTDLSLMLTFLTDPMLRFRICIIAHLLEAAVSITDDSWYGVHPRSLGEEEMNYVMEKLRDLFRELFQQPLAQTSLRRFLTAVLEWSEKRSMNDTDQESGNPDLPEIVKRVIPCHDILSIEYRNLVDASKRDEGLISVAKRLYKFMMLSLRNKAFVDAPDWPTEGRIVIDNLRVRLRMARYHGPSQRLIRNLVSMVHQFWESGGATDTSLAIKRTIATAIRKAVRSSGIDSGGNIGVSLGGWDVMSEIERLIRMIGKDIASIPLPSLLCSGLEVETNRVAYYSITKTSFHKRLADVGEISFIIPPDSLDIDLKFTLALPEIQRMATSAYPTTSKGTNNASTISSGITSSQRTMISVSTADQRALNAQLGRGSSEPVLRTFETGRATARTDTQTRGEAVQGVANDAKTVTQTIKDILYPNQVSCGRLRTIARSSYRAFSQPDRVGINWGLSNDHVAWARQQRAQSTGDRASPVAVQQPLVMPEYIFTPAPGSDRENERERYQLMRVRECNVHLHQLHSQIHETKNPLLHTLAHGIVVRQLRKAFEQAVCEAIFKLVDVINAGVEEIIQVSEEEIKNLHNTPTNMVPGHSGATQIFQDNEQQSSHRYLSPQHQPASTKDTPIFAAMPLMSGTF
ncbi:hypothetical protein BX616_009259 [Lobosporangium transversale]|uniref:Uncharacterized protein n=1 Tax=Lobosporangium transversale TaxID=64571 RepID=A0A1Y2GY22_9FUNG|nr:hypothetical protein BCR41DRAFT_384472 [Lobosporangium transversale]KAF9913954.1 hypothetical protein BX616_009259 [Lobosporangium transversale]ORZ26373.1 hypothetical protein BCR41DRAFT_384472 [Lobosporangium transversale]|eukprot:XP_021884138.1 hypothetical protein BCR41DRAFT_384472 [Lobosporangium transversale]